MPLLQEISPELPPFEAGEAPAAQESQREFGRYLVSMSAFLLAMYCLPFYVVRRADFDQWSNTPYAMPLNYAFRTAGMNADVVVFGDSTALHGIDPSRMTRELGVKVVNLPNTGATLRVMDDLSLKRYLSANRPPQLIVFYFAPWDMDYLHTELPIGTYEGREVLVQEGTPREVWDYARRHPVDALEFPFQFYLANAPFWTIWKRPYLYTGAEVERTQGHFGNPAVNRLDPQCAIPASIANGLGFESVKALGAKYASAETRVLYYIAPVPACRNAAAVVGHNYFGLPAAPPKELPLAMFRGSMLYLHPAVDAVPAVTDELVDAVRPVLAKR